MKFDKGIEAILKAFLQPLPGEEAQRLMSPLKRINFDTSIFPDTPLRESSVLMLLYPGDKDQLKTLLIERTQTRHVHSGQIAFPGGKVEPEDRSVAETALRETEEEVGVPCSSVEIIGQLTPLTIPASRFLVYPHVGVLYSPPEFRLNPLEVQSLLPLNVHTLLDMKPEEHMVTTRYGQLLTPCFPIEHHTLWGATAMMVSEFRVLMQRV